VDAIVVEELRKRYKDVQAFDFRAYQRTL